MSKGSSYTNDLSISESNNGMSHSSASGETPEQVEHTAPVVANQEEKAVTRSKLLFFLVLLLAVSGAATATYLLMESEERNDFETAVSVQQSYMIRI
eukprot:scaffold3628_cov112-Cylindrotheca_fusiformis.AAC.3